MLRIRAFEEIALAAAGAGLVTGAIHPCIGQEAVAVGICANLGRADYLFATHRGHGHTLAKGADPAAMMCELFGRQGGVCGGKGGSMHIADFGVGQLGANGVVAANITIAAGAAHAVKLRGEDRAVVCLFGDGAVNRGPFLEGLNWARIFDLPVLFVCEDNGFAATTRTRALTGGPGPAARAESLGIPAAEVDGNDVVAVDEASRDALAALRAETIAIVPGVPGACNVPGAVVAVPALNGTHQTTMCYVGDSLAFNGLTGLGLTMFNGQANTQGIAQSQASSLHALGLQKLGPPCGGC
ncbi:MAG: thiamine pyrophosphate-dependent dehydrogenase E1 component subunit alpha [Proteobacteria bacterium]|nr:thiamine pyrophosphate-dependent dehydrogenase E1 component subunit alpha [Pseudomonadota bacterium]